MKQSDIVTDYWKTSSIRATASSLGISECTVRKTLITAGLHTSDLIEQIKELSESGKSINEIATLLKRSVSCIYANTPYSKGTYLDEEKSDNAMRVKKCRANAKTKQLSD